MSRLTLVLALCLALPAQSETSRLTLLSQFATCAGRFSAELEHAWLMRDQRAGELEHRRGQFVDLIEATMSTDQESRTLALRIEAKVAHARLLSQATFSQNQTRSRWAIARATAEINYCLGFLLDS